MAAIQQKYGKKALFAIAFFAVGIMIYSIFYPVQTGDSIRRSALMFAEKIFPSLFAFSVSAKILVKSGVCQRLERTPLRSLFSLFGVSAEGFSALLIGFLSGFPTGASMLSEAVAKGSAKKEEAESLLPFCNQAGIAFVVGAVGVHVFRSAEAGAMLFLAQTAAALLGVVLTADTRREVLGKGSCVSVRCVSVSGVFTSAVSESALAMVSVCGYVVFFSVLTDALFSILQGFLPFSEAFFAFFAGISELSSGILMLSESALSMLEKRILCGALLGFGGFSVFLQAADRAEAVGLSLAFYLKGKCMTMAFTAVLAPLFCFLSEMRYGILCVFLVFTAILTIGFVKNKIFFKKSVEKQKGMLYNRNEIYCP